MSSSTRKQGAFEDYDFPSSNLIRQGAEARLFKAHFPQERASKGAALSIKEPF